MKAHWKYLKYVIRHKWFVFIYCLHYHLLWRGITHDWTKFLPSEWFPYVQYFYCEKPPDNSKGYAHRLNEDDIEFNIAWNHHQKRNDHHWQYWFLNFDDGRHLALPMSDKARKELLADWRGAGRAQGYTNTPEWYERNKDKMILHPETREWIEHELAKL